MQACIMSDPNVLILFSPHFPLFTFLKCTRPLRLQQNKELRADNLYLRPSGQGLLAKLKDRRWPYRVLINKCRDRLRRLKKDQRGIWREITAPDHQCSAIRTNMTACRPNQLFTTAKSIELSPKDNHRQRYLKHIHSRK